MLRPIIQADERLLKLYESGLPAWAIYAPLYGLWYRPWLRKLTYAMSIMVSVFSLVMGLYDLYKNVPYLDKVLRSLIDQLHLPSTAIFQWLDSHLQLRISILAAYLLGKSQIARTLLLWLGRVAALARGSLQPISAFLGPPAQAVMAALGAGGELMLGACLTLLWSLATILEQLFGPLLHLLLSVGELLLYMFVPLIQVGAAVLMGPVRMALACARSATLLATCLGGLLGGCASAAFELVALTLGGPLTAASGGLWMIAGAIRAVVEQTGVMVSRAWAGVGAIAGGLGSGRRAVRTSARLAPAFYKAAANVGHTTGVGAGQAVQWMALPDGFAMLRKSVMAVARSLQSISKVLAQFACDIGKHRLTLALRFRRAQQALLGNWQEMHAVVHSLLWPEAPTAAASSQGEAVWGQGIRTPLADGSLAKPSRVPGRESSPERPPDCHACLQGAVDSLASRHRPPPEESVR
eukprot:jgi/Botrbrau1/4434/Bobra.0348s0023.1